MFELINTSTLNAVTILLGLFMVLFMLLSRFIQERIRLGQVPVAILVGIIFGPESAGLIDPLGWGNARAVTREFTRVILAVQCFGNAIELPRRYVNSHWKSLAWIVGPVMLCGWFVTTCCVKLMVPSFDWRQALACAACFNAIDPVVAQSILSGGWSRRVPKHLRNLLRAEAAANGVTTTLVLDLTKYLLRYPTSPGTIATQVFSIALPYEVVFGTVAGFIIGYIARRSLRKAHIADAVDRESLLSFYLSVVLFALGFGTVLGVDEINLCFFAGVGLDNDDWYEERTKESFFASCVDIVLNLSYFVFIGSLVPWRSFNSEVLGVKAWRLVVGTICMFLFRRIPIVMLLGSLIPDIKTHREALFYGHFGPIGAGALFSAFIINAALEPATKSTNSDNSNGVRPHEYHQQLWAVTMFVFVASSIVHGTSIALFTLGRHVNALTLTMSYTRDDDITWMDRLPRIDSRSKSDFLYEDAISGPSIGGPISEPAIAPRRRQSSDSSSSLTTPNTVHTTKDSRISARQEEVVDSPEPPLERPGRAWREGLRRMNGAGYFRSKEEITGSEDKPELDAAAPDRYGPARAYQFGNTIIIEDEDGEVIKKFDIPTAEGTQPSNQGVTRQKLQQMGKMLGLSNKEASVQAGTAGEPSSMASPTQPSDQVQELEEDTDEEDTDHRLRFTLSPGGRRLSTAHFIQELANMDPKRRVQAPVHADLSDKAEFIEQLPRLDPKSRIEAAEPHDGTQITQPDPPWHQSPRKKVRFADKTAV
jgi:NhaP-type Na+/H+ or K+/H+ antiporter